MIIIFLYVALYFFINFYQITSIIVQTKEKVDVIIMSIIEVGGCNQLHSMGIYYKWGNIY